MNGEPGGLQFMEPQTVYLIQGHKITFPKPRVFLFNLCPISPMISLLTCSLIRHDTGSLSVSGATYLGAPGEKQTC